MRTNSMYLKRKIFQKYILLGYSMYNVFQSNTELFMYFIHKLYQII